MEFPSGTTHISGGGGGEEQKKKIVLMRGTNRLKGNQLSVKTGNESLGYDWVISTRNSWPRDGHYILLLYYCYIKLPRP
jgi:hypothetical protein